jgi:uncharacterized protein
VKVHQKVLVTVLGVDLERKRISLSMKSSQPQASEGPKAEGRKKKEERRQERKQRPKSTFTNNPFATAFGNKNQ